MISIRTGALIFLILGACSKENESSAVELVGGSAVDLGAGLGKHVVFVASSGIKQQCTGTYIGKNVVLTAAHCIRSSGQDASKVTVYFASRVRRNENDVVATVDAKNWMSHREYNSSTLENDIALLILPEDFSPPAPFTVFSSLADHTDLQGKQSISVFGFGGTNESSETSGILNSIQGEVEIRAVTDRKCQFELDAIPGKAFGCPIDSGGPLFINQKLYGVNSYRRLEAEDSSQKCVERVTRFTSVGCYADWIKKCSQSSGDNKVCE